MAALWAASFSVGSIASVRQVLVISVPSIVVFYRDLFASGLHGRAKLYGSDDHISSELLVQLSGRKLETRAPLEELVVVAESLKLRS